MAKKIKLSQKKKDKIKNGFNKIRKKDLKSFTKEETKYYNIVKAARERVKKKSQPIDEIEIDGKFYKSFAVEVVKTLAEENGQSINSFLKKNKQEIVNYIEDAEVRNQKTPDSIIEDIDKSKKVKYFINDGNGLVRVGKNEIIRIVSDFQNFVKTETEVVDIRIYIVKKGNGDIVLEMPTPQEYLSLENDPEAIIDLLEINDIFNVISEKKSKAKANENKGKKKSGLKKKAKKNERKKRRR